MSADWPRVPLREVMKLDVDVIPVDPSATYRISGVYSFGRGLLAREPLAGTETTYKAFHRLHTDQFVLSQLKGWEGALARVTPEFDGWFLSPQFPTFRADPAKLDIGYLEWYCRQASVWDDLRSTARGMGARRDSVSPDRFLALAIPLPPVPEQRRIVTRVEAVAARLAEARRLREEATIETAAVLKAGSAATIGASPTEDWVELRTYVREIENGWSPACESRPASAGEWGVLKVGAVSFGRFDPRENKALPTTLEPRPEYEVRAGDFLMSRANNPELTGACAVVEATPPRLLLSDKHFRFHFHEAGRVDIRYLDYVLKSPALRDQIERAATGTSPTMKNISKDKVLGLLIPRHDKAEQRRIVAHLDGLRAKADALRALQAETAAELDALLPAVLARAFAGRL